jgi:hypothetical protein
MNPKVNQLQAWYAHIKRELRCLEQAIDDEAGEIDEGEESEISRPIAWPEMCESTDDVIAYLMLLRGIIGTPGYTIRPGYSDGELELVAVVDGDVRPDPIRACDFEQRDAGEYAVVRR